MKKIVILVLVTVLLISGLVSAPAQGATPDEIEQSIEDGLAWLTSVQNPDGSWGLGERVATTGLVLIKLEDRAYEIGKDSPFDPTYEYSGNVTAGLNYLLNGAHITSIGPQTAGDPDTDGDGIGIAFYDYLSHSVYATGICLMALAGTRDPARVVNTGPLSGNTTGEVVQDTVDWLVWAQTDSGYGRGGWNYGPMNNAGSRSDNSISGYAVLGLDFAESPTFGFSANITAFVRSELNHWIDYIQTDGGSNDGGSGYTSPGYWVNILKTGNLIYQMAFYGDSPTTPRVIDAVAYIERHWNVNNPDPGFRPSHHQAMYCLMKGLGRMGIDEITVGSSTIDWFDEISSIIVADQNANGSWPSDTPWDYYGGRLTAAWALLTLEKVTPPSEIEVPLDIKPTSCPNPINVKSKGVIPVAVIGTEDLEVTQIDVDTLLLEGVSPIRSEIEDVAAPYDGEISDPAEREDCTMEGPDGIADLTLKFNKQEVVTAIGDVDDGDVIVLTLTGNLLEDFGGTAIMGQDVVWIKKKGK